MRAGSRLMAVPLAAALLCTAAGSAAAGPPGDDDATFGVVSLNAWHGGTQVDDGVAKTEAFVRSSGADVFGMQETEGTLADELAGRLGWHSYQTGDVALLSRYPIVERFQSRVGVGARMQLDDGRQAVVWTVHLNYTPYGPYDACFDHMTPQQILDREESSGRVDEIRETLEKMAPQIEQARAGGAPVFLTGDFNAPSHLDWTGAAQDSHCGYTVQWPTSVAVAEAGLADSFREANADPVATPGNTWSPVYPKHDGSTGADEPQDRIDFVHHAGSARTVSSTAEVRGEPAPVPDHAGNEWPTDHAAVVSFFSW